MKIRLNWSCNQLKSFLTSLNWNLKKKHVKKSDYCHQLQQLHGILRYGCTWEVDHGSRQRASLIYFIKYLTYLHLGQIDRAFIWLLYRFRRFFSSFLSRCLTWKLLCFWGFRRVYTHTRWRVNSKIILLRAHGNITAAYYAGSQQRTVNTKHLHTITPPPGDLLRIALS